MEQHFSSLIDFLNWITGPSGGAVVLVSMAVAMILEKWDQWHALDASIKSLLIAAMSIVLGLAAAFLAGQPALVAQLDPIFKVVASILGVWVTTQVGHKLAHSTPSLVALSLADSEPAGPDVAEGKPEG